MAMKFIKDLPADGQIYMNLEMNFQEAIIPPGPWNTAHGPSIVETPSDTLLCCWFAGTFEGDTDVNIVVSRLSLDSDQWEEPIQISTDNSFSNQNPSLFIAPNNDIWCMYTSQEGRLAGKDNMQYTAVVKCQVSHDDGRTWDEPRVILSKPGTFARQPIQVLSNGRWIYGLWLCSDSKSGLAGDPSAVAISDDEGLSWHTEPIPNSAGKVHPTIVELQNGHLMAFMRSRAADWIYKSESFDFGDSWSEPVQTPLPNNNSGIAAIKLQSGRIAIAYNHNSAPESYGHNGAWPALRNPISIALSEDGGMTFPLIRNIELGQGFAGSENRFNNKQYEYPCILQSANGKIHVAYAYKNRMAIKWVSLFENDVIGEVRGQGVYNPTSGEGARK